MHIATVPLQRPLPADLPVLRRLLFETGYCELKEATEARFHDFRWGAGVGTLAFSGSQVPLRIDRL